MRSLVLLPLLLTSCGEVPATNEAAPPPPVVVTPHATPTATSFAPDSAEAAADVVRRYHAAITARRYEEADALREPEGDAAPAANFARYATWAAEVGTPGRIDSGAGQRYITVPFTVVAARSGGGDERLVGSAVLHHVADIDGATPEQRRWRIRSIEWAPAR